MIEMSMSGRKLIFLLILAAIVAYLSSLQTVEKSSTGHGECVPVHTAEAAKRILRGQDTTIMGGKIIYKDLYGKTFEEYHTWIKDADLTNDATTRKYEVFYQYKPTSNIFTTIASLRIYKLDKTTPKAIFENISLFRNALKKEEQKNG